MLFFSAGFLLAYVLELPLIFVHVFLFWLFNSGCIYGCCCAQIYLVSYRCLLQMTLFVEHNGFFIWYMFDATAADEILLSSFFVCFTKQDKLFNKFYTLSQWLSMHWQGVSLWQYAELFKLASYECRKIFYYSFRSIYLKENYINSTCNAIRLEWVEWLTVLALLCVIRCW